MVEVKLASPGAVGFTWATRETGPLFVGVHGQEAANEELLPVAGNEIQRAMRLPFAKKVTVD